MHPALAGDLSRLPELLQDARDFAARELTGLAERPVAAAGRAPGRAPLPAEGAGAEAALTRFAERWAPGFSGSAGPRYLGFVTGGATPASVAGDWLTSALDQNLSGAGGSWAAELERETVAWLRELFGLCEAHGGAFVTGATMSNTVGLAIAREWLGERLGVDVSRQGAAALGPVDVLSGSPHSSITKAMSVLGIGRDRLRLVPLLPGGREAVDVTALEAALAGRDGRPAIVVANAGTVNTVDFDDLRAIAALKERYGFWLHVDAAFGAFAALSPEHAALVDGLDAADSVCVDLHKWLNVPYDAAVQFTRRPDLQVAVFHNASPYLGPPTGEPDFLHLTPENSRRLRALPAWFSLVAYGRAGHREIVERNVTLARRLGAGIDALPGLRLLAPVRLNVVCFTLAGDPSQERVDALARAVAASGEAYVTPTVYGGVPGLRAAFSNWRTTRADTDRVLEALAAASG
ncbi:Glutamate or tyrosine decarboxylase [Streptomyces sp. 1222.5]|uniref:pyridoxal phosphate-dependent decarboxylase family protein n=1 Tax=unclassified Streptomyces TaxID=2593676 RepID=UPI000894615D|nr:MULTISPECIES: pyridoxal-dependent decarboxylase [unclassified Streptomyces]PKW11682.1 glutamate/tyrosine decarboxylase-like PLP-dependent enzyme [Streptomyces sp. 5112.2]SEB72624.1 Glutamate or tyrosine decarboxylase [Streptomyces sp. 1222.5]SEE17948.1 Glutamate or tyrosine decarboxylase [Streptomyces sp. 2231.1]